MFHFNLLINFVSIVNTLFDSEYGNIPLDLSGPIDHTSWKSLINSIELPVNILLDGNIYRLVREFERGGAGRVFMAIHDSSRTEVVIKLWSPRRLDRAMHDLRNQASSLRALQPMIHTPEIVSLTAEGRALILELVRGPSGREWLQSPRDFQVDLQRLIMIERTAGDCFNRGYGLPMPTHTTGSSMNAPTVN